MAVTDHDGKIKVEELSPDTLKRGPGGHWYCYRAWMVGKAAQGYGQTALEATLDLKSKL